MITLSNGDIARYLVTISSPDGEGCEKHGDLLDRVDNLFREHVRGGEVCRDGLNRWYLGYEADDSLGLTTLLATAKGISRSKRIKDAGLEVYWKEPGWAEERL